ncbi:hypothetical protein ACQY0O_006358 [Thecaphora frezii]
MSPFAREGQQGDGRPPPIPPSDGRRDTASSNRTSSPTSEVNGELPRSTTHQHDVAIRKRVYRACEVCRRKKVKCSGQKPCSHCIAFVEECHYVETRDRTAYSRRYVESLEQRLAKMEQAFLLASEDQHLRINDGNPPLPESEPLLAPSMSPPLHTGSEEEGRRDRADRSRSSSRPSSTNRARRSGVLWSDSCHLRYIGPLSTVALISEASASISVVTGRGGKDAISQLGYHGPPWCSTLLDHTVPCIEQGQNLPSLPPKPICDRAIQAFFDRVHPIFPVLSRDSFVGAYEARFGGPANTLNTDAVFQALVLAVMACGEMVSCPSDADEAGPHDALGASFELAPYPPSQRTSLDADVSSYFAQSCHVGVGYTFESRFEVVQLLSLQAYYLAARNCPADAWIQAGQALRLSVDLGLHRDLDHEAFSDADREVRRRVWWCIYILDRLLGINIGRPPGIEDDDVDAQLPRGEDGMTALMPGFVAMVSLSRQAGRIARTSARLQTVRNQAKYSEETVILRRLRTHDSALEAWLDSLPETLKSHSVSHDPNDPLAVQSCAAFAGLHATRIRLQQALPRDPDLLPATLSSEEEAMDLARCTQTALHIIRGASRAARLIPPGPFLLDYSHHLLVAGEFLALNAARRIHANAFQLLNEAEEAINGFRCLERSFPAATEHRNILVRTVRTVRQWLGELASASPASPGLKRAGSVAYEALNPVFLPALGQRSSVGTAGSAQTGASNPNVGKRRRRTVSGLPDDSSNSAAMLSSAPVAAPCFNVAEDWSSTFAAYDSGPSQRGQIAPEPSAMHPGTAHAVGGSGFDAPPGTPCTVIGRFERVHLDRHPEVCRVSHGLALQDHLEPVRSFSDGPSVLEPPHHALDAPGTVQAPLPRGRDAEVHDRPPPPPHHPADTAFEPMQFALEFAYEPTAASHCSNAHRQQQQQESGALHPARPHDSHDPNTATDLFASYSNASTPPLQLGFHMEPQLE